MKKANRIGRFRNDKMTQETEEERGKAPFASPPKAYLGRVS
jgi:hypothetical protein